MSNPPWFERGELAHPYSSGIFDAFAGFEAGAGDKVGALDSRKITLVFRVQFDSGIVTPCVPSK